MEILKNKLSNRIILIISLLFLLSISISAVNAAENITDLGNLITASPDDSTVELGEGTYKTNVTNINIDKNITIVGKGADKTIIDANKAGRIFNIQYNGTLTLINLTLINGNDVGYYGGGAIYNEGTLNLINCGLNNNTADYGGAISSFWGTNLNIINSTFANNTARYSAGAISSAAEMHITKCVFTNNQAPEGGAIFSGFVVLCNITDSIFIDNTAENGGAIILTNSTVIINNCVFTNNTATYGSAIYNIYGYPNLTVDNSNFTYNKGGPTIYLDHGTNTTITGCNIFNNSHGILTMTSQYYPNDYITINYNRIFNNTAYDLNSTGTNVNADYNWWGNNTPTKIIGITPNNYFIMNVTNLTSLDSNGTVTFNYTFKLNNGGYADNSLLPYFVTNVYTNVTTGIIESFDARFDRTFDITVYHNGSILYIFVDNNEVQTLEGTITIPPTPTPNPTPEPVTNQTSNNPTTSAVMKETGIPITILLVLLSLFGFGYYRKE